MKQHRSFKIESSPRFAKPRKLIANYTFELNQDVICTYYAPPWYVKLWNIIRGKSEENDYLTDAKILAEELQKDINTHP